MPKTLPVASLEVLPSVFQVRPRHDAATGISNPIHVDVLAAHLLSSPKYELDPITVILIGQRHILIEGHHRLAAYRREKRETIPVRFFKGSPQQALVESGRDNKKDRLPMGRTERSERAWALVVADLGLTVPQIVEGSGVKERTVKMMRKKRKEILAEGKELPEQWASVLYGEREANPAWFDEQVKNFADRLTKTFGPGATFSPGKQEIMADALIAWDQGRAVNIAMELVERLGLYEEVASHAALLAEEAKEFENLPF
ncbi:hypothetical protein ACQ86G_13240 [Roseateles chitinivorans]|uniref:hypothetical protein n=1 Tax=Roseateles chitinivorans TaxID=2917965 RepID=UPI003D671EAC